LNNIEWSRGIYLTSLQWALLFDMPQLRVSGADALNLATEVYQHVVV
jgi:hypothetical protein